MYGPFVCALCTTTFFRRSLPVGRSPKYCTVACFNETQIGKPMARPPGGWNAKGGGVTFTCRECGAEGKTTRALLRTKRFCSMVCRNANYAKRRGSECGFFGKRHSERTRVLLGNINRRTGKRPPSRLGQVPWNKGKEIFYNRGDKNSMRRPEVRRAMAERFRGERGTNWKGGVSEENKRIRMGLDFKLWREAVFRRDDWTCCHCGNRGGVLHPHHILHFAKFPLLRFDVGNGETLCQNCHQKEHSKILLSVR